MQPPSQIKPTPAAMLVAARSLLRNREVRPAIEAYEAYLNLRPKDANAWADLGAIHLEAGNPRAAQKACERALRLNRDHTQALVTKANALTGLGLLQEAEVLCCLVLRQHPRLSEAKIALVECLIKRGDLAPPRALLEQLLALEPDHHQAHSLLIELLVRQRLWEDFDKAYDRFISSKKHPPVVASHDQGMLDLRMGRMLRGWERYEARLDCPGAKGPYRNLSEPRWRGEPFPGKTLLIFFEQGLGDTIMFIRYAALAKARGGRVLLAPQASLAGVLATCPGVDEVVLPGAPMPPFDLQVPLLSLPWLFRTDLDSIPDGVPYLAVPPIVPNRQAITEVLARSDGQIRIGLVWAGNPDHKRDQARSIDPARLAPLAALPGVAWHSFHMGPEQPPLPGVVSLHPLLSNFSDTAHALDSMDLLITVDTAMAHLAGAMGIPTLMLLDAFPDFRWMLGRSDSPWYPTMSLHRQEIQGDWESVLGRLLAELGSQS